MSTGIRWRFLVGFALTGEGLEHAVKESLGPDFAFNIPKGYIYFAMAFSFIVEMVNIKMRKKNNVAIKLHKEME